MFIVIDPQPLLICVNPRPQSVCIVSVPLISTMTQNQSQAAGDNSFFDVCYICGYMCYLPRNFIF